MNLNEVQNGGLGIVHPEAGVRTQPSGQTAQEACRSFEAYFIEQIFNTMTQATMEKTSGSDGPMKSWLWEVLAQQVAQDLSHGAGLGLAKQIAAAMDGPV